MELIRPFERLGKDDAGIAGGKGASLGEMTQAGIPVPPGFVILTHAFERFLDETDLRLEIVATLNDVKHDQIHTVERASDKIQAFIKEAMMPADIAKEIETHLAKLGATYVAVRSSATAEDGTAAAWAGQLDTFLNTTEQKILENVQRCWASLFTPRAIFYRFEKGMHGDHISVAVVVQKMIESESSGIAFSVHPVTEDRNQLIIEAGYGLGEAIVSGQVTPDSYVVTKDTRSIIDKNIATQSRALVRAESDGNEWKDVPEPRASAQILSDAQILELSELIVTIENHYDLPQDIEWAHEGGTFYITQSRPITTLSASATSEAKSARTTFHKEYEREFPLILAEAWYDVFEKIVADAGWGTPPAPFMVEHMRDGIVEYWMNHECTQWLEDKMLQENQKGRAFFDTHVAKYEICQRALKEIYKRSSNPTIEDVEKVVSLIDESYFGWYAMYFTGQNPDTPKDILDDALLLRAQDTFGDDVCRYLERSLQSLYPALSDLVLCIRKNEVSSPPSARELRERQRHFVIFRDGNDRVAIVESLSQFEAERPHVRLVQDATSAHTDIVEGSTGCAGKARGVVRILKKRSHIDLLQEGEILVTSMTTPDFIPAMKKAAAVVTDEGGIMCHAAIFSRELNRPCVIGTKNATDILKDGDLVEVDADAGTVKILESEGGVPTLLGPGTYRFVGLYKCLPFAFWFWAAWYSKERLDALGLSIDFGGYCGVKGGNNLVNVAIAEQFKAGLLAKIESDDVAYFSALESQAADEFDKAVAWAEHIGTDHIGRDFENLVDHARSIMFYWFIGWLSSQSIDETLRAHAAESGIVPDDIASHIKQPDTPLIRQQAEAKGLKARLVEKGIWEQLKTNPAAAFASIEADTELSALLTHHVNENEWLPIINFVGEKFTIEKLLEQMSFFKDVEVHAAKGKTPPTFEKYVRIASHIGYLNQASAEYFSIFTNKVMPFLESLAKELGVPYRDMLHLVPQEISAGLAGSLDIRPIIERRRNDNSVIYTAVDGTIQIIDDAPTVERITDMLLPKPETSDASVIKGQIGNKGKARGPARIIIATDDFHKMQDGDVLVTPMTTPDFVLLMQKSAAIVTDMGGMLCHAAIVSREMGKPCVIDTKFATQLLKDGDMVEVDADVGIVRMLTHEQ